MDMKTFAGRCRCLGVSLIQYRNKTDDAVQVKAQLERLRAEWDGVLIVNDRWQLHRFCDGVHIGQEDLYAIGENPHIALQRLKGTVGEDAIIGLSTHNADEIAVANTLSIDYIGLGAFRKTGTKAEAAVLADTLDTLAAVSRHPVAAIGGVTFDDRFESARMRVMGRALFEAAL